MKSEMIHKRRAISDYLQEFYEGEFLEKENHVR
jgi:hypothetical protein